MARARWLAAVNEWQIETWLEPEPRLRSGLVVPYEDGDLTVKEIERLAAIEPGFVQLMLAIRTSEPLGRRKYWPIYEAAERHGLPIGIHFGGQGGHADRHRVALLLHRGPHRAWRSASRAR